MWRQWSLRHKLLTVILLVLLGTGSGLVSLVLVGAEQERQRGAARSARAVSAAIDRTLRSAMLSGDREVVRAAMETLSEQAEVINLSVFDKTTRKVIRAGQQAEWRQAVDGLVRRARSADVGLSEQIGDTAHAVVLPVRSQAGCMRCHGEDTRLGFIAAVVSTAEEEARIQRLRNRLLWGGLLLLAITCAVIYFAVSHWVERPVSRLTQVVDSMRSKGPEAADKGGDEIARLEHSFRSMLAEIGEKTEALLRVERDLAHSQRLVSIGLLAAGIAHEIGGPLSSIQLQAGFWQQHAEGPLRDAAMAIVQAAKQVGALQQELLTFDRRETLQLRRRDLRLLVQHCLNLVETPELHCRLESPEEPIFASADENLLARALSNILNNAAQAMEGKGTLTVAVRRAKGNRAEVLIQDTGPGIPKEDLPHIFEPFFTRKGVRGAGLGLAIAREIIVRHAGQISAETTPAGASFRISLPLSPEEANGTHPDCG